MKRKLLIGMFAVVAGVIGIVIVLANENALLVHPKGIITQRRIRTNYCEYPSHGAHHYANLGSAAPFSFRFSHWWVHMDFIVIFFLSG